MIRRQNITVSLCVGGLFLVLNGCGGGVETDANVVLKPTYDVAPEAGKEGGTSKTGGNGTGGGDSTTTEPEAGGVGIWKGKVQIAAGDALPEPKIRFAVGKATADPQWCAAKQPIMNRQLIVNQETRGIANVFIWLEEMPDGGKAETSSSQSWEYLFDQKNCTFVPHGMVVRTGQPIKVVSSDQVKHNVHSRPLENAEFNESLSAGETTEMTYQSPEFVPVKVVCDIHTWMNAYQLPVSHPYAAVTNEKGEFTIADLPAGDYEFKVWHEAKGWIHRGLEVTITGGDNTQTIDVSAGELLGAFEGPKPRTVLLSGF
ncbi:carboxypeptidase regulatory-like domain-containing protein [Thalassoroseus pseudoceratinae]|uniref:carboxypeptidase regulatory-like domain-containing protein n=1 Tax=Thalassoroseus pseudoceratinae TaxID=2713176 RepID=UPI00142079F6|nr:carboxypeptidase regulatory-like domain-containing protein [Thalassoroseus pseudoceratinae]